MKRALLLWFFSILILLPSLVKAQNSVAVSESKTSLPKSEKVRAMEKQFFGCAKCNFISRTEGICPHDQVPLIRIGNFYCPVMHGYTSAAKGQCPEHKIPLKEMEFKYTIVNQPKGK
jgi:hypothetical protein